MLFFRYFVLAILFAITCTAVAQNESSSTSKIPKPKLPVIDNDACPGKSDPIPNVKLVKDDVVYSSPVKGKLLARLRAGEKVTVLAGANVIHQPDRAVIKHACRDDSSWPPLNVGEIVLGYGWHVDGNMMFWAKGVWFNEDLEHIAGKVACGFTSGFGPEGCSIDIIKGGVIEWWVRSRPATVSVAGSQQSGTTRTIVGTVGMAISMMFFRITAA
jgi:hypothetical protein